MCLKIAHPPPPPHNFNAFRLQLDEIFEFPQKGF